VADRFHPKDGMLRLRGKMLSKTFSTPIRSLFWVAGFAFSTSRVITDVPYDPHLPFLFFGEEQLMNVRLWTHGFDFYAPPESVVYHLWSRSYRPTFHELDFAFRNEAEQSSQERVRKLLGLETKSAAAEDHTSLDGDRFRVGSKRSVESFETFTGVSLKNRTVSEHAKTGGLQKELFVDHLIDTLMTLSNAAKS